MIHFIVFCFVLLNCNSPFPFMVNRFCSFLPSSHYNWKFFSFSRCNRSVWFTLVRFLFIYLFYKFFFYISSQFVFLTSYLMVLKNIFFAIWMLLPLLPSMADLAQSCSKADLSLLVSIFTFLFCLLFLWLLLPRYYFPIIVVPKIEICFCFSIFGMPNSTI